jgi:hypothetical protein
MSKLMLLASLSLSLNACRTTEGYSENRLSTLTSQATTQAADAKGARSTATTADTSPCGALPDPKASREGLAFRKVVGGLEKGSTQAQVYDCRIKLSELAEPESFQKMVDLIAQAPLVTAYLFRATVPSIQICVYRNGEELLLFESASTAMYRGPLDPNALENGTAAELTKIVNQKCAYP